MARRMDTGAEFSDCGAYRYRLWRVWDRTRPMALWLMLNPSTADETANDPTVERCQRRALAAGYGGLLVANIFALRSTDPRGLYAHRDPVGPVNDDAILTLADQAAEVVCGWGNHGGLYRRGRKVVDLLREHGHTPLALRMTKAGEPGHPLYVPYSVQPGPMGDAA